MSEADRRPPTVHATGTVTLRLPPADLIMVARVRAAEATLELGLETVRRLAADAARRLGRLGAARVETGPPVADDQADPDPMTRMAAATLTRLRRPGATAPDARRGVNVAVTGFWAIAGRPADEVLLLVDRLRFDAAADDDPPPAPPETPPPWAGPEEQMQAIMAQVTAPVPEDRSPKFVFLARAGDAELTAAYEAAFADARRKADRVAAAAGRRVGELVTVHAPGFHPGRADQLMEAQRVAALLAAGGYTPAEGEIAAGDPRAAEMTISLSATFGLV